MSDTDPTPSEVFEVRKETNKDLERLIKYLWSSLIGIITLSIGFGGWASTLSLGIAQQKEISTNHTIKIEQNEVRIRSIEQVNASNTAATNARLDAIKEMVTLLLKRTDP